MGRKKSEKSLLLANIISNATSMQKRNVQFTPLIAIVVALLLDRLNFVQLINSFVRWDEKQWKVSPGNLTKAIVLVPFISTSSRIPLYAIHENFQSVDMSLLFKDKINPEWLTRDRFACLLDRIYEAGCEKIFTNIALKVHSVFNIPFKPVFHGDTTSIVLYGEYDQETPDPDTATPAYGYSKDGKSNLKQVLVGLITDSWGIPLRVTVRDGNQNDTKWNSAIIDSLADLAKTAKTGVTYIADCKLTTAGNITKLLKNSMQFVTVCPANFEKKLAERVIRSAYQKADWVTIGTYKESKNANLAQYEVQEFVETVCGTVCRLLVFRSSKTKKDASDALNKENKSILSIIADSTSKEFSCEADARKEIFALEKNLKSKIWTATFSLIKKEITLEKRGRGRPAKSAKPLKTGFVWMITSSELIPRPEKYNLFLWRTEAFVLFTNALAENQSSVEILRLYKEQKTVEDNFSVLKRPALVDTLFLHLPRRIVALITLLSFSLLIQVIIRILVQRNLDAMETKPGIDHKGKSLDRIGLKKIIRFIGYYTIVSEDGSHFCQCKTEVHRAHLETWLKLLEMVT